MIPKVSRCTLDMLTIKRLTLQNVEKGAVWVRNGTKYVNPHLSNLLKSLGLPPKKSPLTPATRVRTPLGLPLLTQGIEADSVPYFFVFYVNLYPMSTLEGIKNPSRSDTK